MHETVSFEHGLYQSPARERPSLLPSSFLVDLEHVHIFEDTCLEVPFLGGIIDILYQLANQIQSFLSFLKWLQLTCTPKRQEYP